MGHILSKMTEGPKAANCPKDNSMNIKGKPTNTNIRMKGNRNAPAHINQHSTERALD
jgi:hypothetical protein